MSGLNSKAPRDVAPGFSVDDYYYALPAARIAQRPPRQRGASRLLCVDGGSGALQDRRFTELRQLLDPRDLLIFNDTRVLPARIYGNKDSGGRVEIMLERLTAGNTAIVQIKASKSPRPGGTITLENTDISVQVIGRKGEFFQLRFPKGREAQQVFVQHGRMPLPPYIRRDADESDRDRYQTVYARSPGAVAAPTAGLHFDEALLRQLGADGVEMKFVTLHVAAGTFQPLRVDDIRLHSMHAEHLEVSEEACDAIRRARARGGRVVAVGTTVVRALETACRSGEPRPFSGETDIFIYPGHRFRAVDALLTNFHLPGSTLLMLVCAFAGHKTTLNAYRHAVTERYRFYSYGDAMWLTPAVRQ